MCIVVHSTWNCWPLQATWWQICTQYKVTSALWHRWTSLTHTHKLCWLRSTWMTVSSYEMASCPKQLSDKCLHFEISIEKSEADFLIFHEDNRLWLYCSSVFCCTFMHMESGTAAVYNTKQLWSSTFQSHAELSANFFFKDQWAVLQVTYVHQKHVSFLAPRSIFTHNQPITEVQLKKHACNNPSNVIQVSKFASQSNSVPCAFMWLCFHEVCTSDVWKEILSCLEGSLLKINFFGKEQIKMNPQQFLVDVTSLCFL